ncbi:MAG: SDR family oxidoreductase [Candidatus Gastranaerophilales bacterium]|nr:SDR family oxidoreductase [Candidatus Gastranaerophilales bacterium]
MKKQKSVLISGTSTGIGNETAFLLADNGFKVFAGVRKKKDFANLNHENITPILLDITNNDSVKECFEIINRDNNDFISLINNAGIALAGPAEFLPIEEYQKQLEINLLGHIRVIQAFLPLVRKNNGRIVNISSIAGFCAFPFNSAYCVSKFALEAYSRSLRLELKQWDIKLILIQPGVIQTPIWEKSKKMAQENFNNLSSDAHNYYQNAFDKILKEKNKKRTSSIQVAKAILHAVKSKNPKNKYLIGKDAIFLNFLTKMPQSLQEWLFFLKLKARIK